jgi:hypothetical protein
VRKAGGKRQIGRPVYRWTDNVEMKYRGIEWGLWTESESK